MQSACRYGVRCHRQDCRYSHPNGREIDGMYIPPQQQQQQPRSNTLCRYSVGCMRMDCHFVHPNGRNIDGTLGMPQIPIGNMNGEQNQHLYHSNSGRSMSSSTSDLEYDYMLNVMAQQSDEDEAIRRELWYPEARDCPCCKGHVYGCSDPTCQAMGMCGCRVASLCDEENAAAEAEASEEGNTNSIHSSDRNEEVGQVQG